MYGYLYKLAVRTHKGETVILAASETIRICEETAQKENLEIPTLIS